MYNHSQIRTGLYGLVGLRQSLITEYAIVSAANLATSSGMYFQDYHSLVNVENLKNVAPEGLSDADFNTWFADLVKGSVVKNVNFIMQRFRPQTKSLFENLRLFNYASVFDTPLTLTGNAFVGYEIELCHADNIMVVLNSIGLMFDGADTFNVYVFHSSQSNPIYTIEVTPEANIEAWEAQTSELEHITDTYVGGKFYIGYLQQDLTATPINREWNEANVQETAKLFSITPMTVSGHATATMFDMDDIDYTSDTYGLNFAFTAWNNVTKQIITQKAAFTNVIGYGVAVDILTMIANSTRDNAIKKETRDLAIVELNTELGLKKKLEDEIKVVHIDLAGLDPLTLKKRNRIMTYTGR